MSGQVELVVAELSHIDAALEGSDALSAALEGAEIANDWVRFPEALPPTREAIAGRHGGSKWGAHLFLLAEPRTLVGWGGFKGEPADGEVELGYSIAPAFEGRGLATAAVEAMIAKAVEHGGVTAVFAHTLAEPNASTRVLEKAGFSRDSEAHVEDGQEVWRWSRTV